MKPATAHSPSRALPATLPAPLIGTSLMVADADAVVEAEVLSLEVDAAVLDALVVMTTVLVMLPVGAATAVLFCGKTT